MTSSARADGAAPTHDEAGDVQLAAGAAFRPIIDIADELGLDSGDVEQHGKYAAKIWLTALDRLVDVTDGKLVCVTAVTPTKAGEGKTTTAISLADALGGIGEKASSACASRR